MSGHFWDPNDDIAQKQEADRIAAEKTAAAEAKERQAYEAAQRAKNIDK